MTLPDPGPWGAYLAIGAMALATYLCRISGVALMSVIPLTPHVRRGLAALPGSIVAATVLPLIERLGWAAGIALLAAMASMIVRRSELLALVTGMAVISGLRALGF
ncbi:AzlD family protein [Bosea sp. (in: a-proteobacteria)]|uniref:AzlD family protein n=1 Tax=Bosea sp. (in: a-proteobacteria) TaxID=1871050 RepID=UPI003B3AC419